MLSFWVRREGQDIWEPVPAEGAVLEEGTYTIVARSPQPYFTITVEVRQYPLAQEAPESTAPSSQPAQESKSAKGGVQASPLQIHSRSVRTNEEGIGTLLAATYLAPGFWELHCRDADLIAELFGEAETENCLRLQVVPKRLDAPSSPKEAGERVSSPLAEPDPSGAGRATVPANSQGETGEVLSPPSRHAWSPDLFSLMHTDLEGSPEEVLVLTGRIGCSGELRVQVWQPGIDQPIFEGQRLIQFPPEARTAVFSIPITLPKHSWRQPLEGELQLTPAAPTRLEPKGSPSPLKIAFSIRCRGEKKELEDPPSQSLARLREEAAQATSSGSSSQTALLSPERTLQKLLRMCQQSPATPEWQPMAAAEEGDSSAPAPEEVSLQPAPEPKALPSSPEPPSPGIPVAPLEQLLPASPSPAPANPEQPAEVASPRESLLPPKPAGLCPTPQLWIPERLRAGDNFDVVLRLPAPADPPPNGLPPQAPFWIKFWVKHGRTRSLVDGPRWLLDFSWDEQGQWQALTRMTIPPGVPELIFEAWAVSPDRQQQSDRVTERRLIQP